MKIDKIYLHRSIYYGVKLLKSYAAAQLTYSTAVILTFVRIDNNKCVLIQIKNRKKKYNQKVGR